MIFGRIKAFISYDSKTAYSTFASFCGVDSIIIPDNNVTIEDWLPEDMRYGLSYGIENVEWARKTRPLLLAMIKKDIENTNKVIIDFISDVNDYFPHKPFR
jgi:hypothetical protein